MPTAVESQTEKIPLSLIHLSALPKSRSGRLKNFQTDRCGETLCAPYSVELMNGIVGQ
jgi:hypothetical protein